jgi:Polysaccharide pyruvyl transferase
LAGLNLSMLEPPEVWNPFEFLLERDSVRAARADLVFTTPHSPVPVVGVVLVHPQKEYASGLHERAHAVIRRLCQQRQIAVVEIDTRLDQNTSGLRSPAEVESLIARMDLVLTTRLHGLVLALKHGVPVLAIDPIAGGAKVSRQAKTIGWPLAFIADQMTDAEFDSAFAYCLTKPARTAARACARRALRSAHRTREQFISWLSSPTK